MITNMKETPSAPKGERTYRLFGQLLLENPKLYLNTEQFQKLETLEPDFLDRE